MFVSSVKHKVVWILLWKPKFSVIQGVHCPWKMGEIVKIMKNASLEHYSSLFLGSDFPVKLSNT